MRGPVTEFVRYGDVSQNFEMTLFGLGLPVEILAQIQDFFGQQVDFSAPALTGDNYKIAYEHDDSATSQDVSSRLTRIELHLQGRKLTAIMQGAIKADGIGYVISADDIVRSTEFETPIDEIRISSRFGVRIHPTRRSLLRHTGVDFAAIKGTNVFASARGTVSITGYDPHGYGKFVVLHHAGGFSTLYAHLSKVASTIQNGMNVVAGQNIGIVGRTGDATGTHLHFEIRYRDQPVDPLSLVTKSTLPMNNSQLTLLKSPFDPVTTAFPAKVFLSDSSFIIVRSTTGNTVHC